MKTDPTRKARDTASQLSRIKRGEKVYINLKDEKYVVGKKCKESVLCYKDGSEVAL